MTFKSLFGQITILSLSLVNFRVSRFHVSHLTHETFKLCLQNTLNMSKTVRVYFLVLQFNFTWFMFHGFIIQIGTYYCAKAPVGSYWFISPERHIFVLISYSYTYTGILIHVLVLITDIYLSNLLIKHLCVRRYP